jgi:hypothetical protein
MRAVIVFALLMGCGDKPQLGKPCRQNSDCASGYCLEGTRCTAVCRNDGECLSGWSCAPLTGVPDKLCQCAPASEVCDGADNDCNGAVDDGATCGPGQECRAGSCVCTGTMCGDACVDVSSDAAHCGRCDGVCSPGADCSAGVCVCASGQTDCGQACADLERDAAHCGSCGHACGMNETCSGGSCSCTATQCGSTCADLQSDAAHCGTCERDCLGSGCQSGLCQPKVLFQSGGAGYPLVKGGFIYFLDGQQAMRMQLDGSGPLKLGAFTKPQALATDGTSLYVYEDNDSGIYRLPAGGGTPTRILDGVNRPGGLQVFGDHLYWAQAGKLERSALDGSARETLVNVLGQSSPIVTIDGTHSYWGDGTSMLSGPVAPPALAQGAVVAGAPGYPMSLTVHAGVLYWTLYQQSGVHRVPVGGGTPDLLPTVGNASEVAVDDSGIYAAVTTEVQRLGAAAVTVGSVGSGFAIGGLQLGDQSVFFGQYDWQASQGWIYGLAK